MPSGGEPLPDELRTRETLQRARAFLAEAEARFQEEGAGQEMIQFSRTAAQMAENARALAVGAVGGLIVRQLRQQIEELRVREAEARQQIAQAQRERDSLRDRSTQLEAALDQERRRTRELESQLLALRERIGLLEQSVEQAGREKARLAAERNKICAELRRQLASLGQLTERGGQLVLNLASDILFDFNRHNLRPPAREQLAKLAVVRLLLFPGAAVRYEGHTDLVGEEDYNQWLSEQRALAVYRYFLAGREEQSQNEDERAHLQERLQVVERLLDMGYNTARRRGDERREWLSLLGDIVVGKGMREPVVPELGPDERNRRVSLIFPEARVGELPSLCAAVPSAE